jgi:hypothetical protein
VLYLRREVVDKGMIAPLKGQSMENLIAEFGRRCNAATDLDAALRQRLRDAVLHDAGEMAYDHVEQEFRVLATRLNWPAAATLKDVRHFFATSTANAGLPEPYVRFLLGHSPGRAAIVAYTHLDKLREQYTTVICQTWSPLLERIQGRLAAVS